MKCDFAPVRMFAITNGVHDMQIRLSSSPVVSGQTYDPDTDTLTLTVSEPV